MALTPLILSIVLLIILIYSIQTQYVKSKSSLDNENYHVLEHYEDKSKAADALARANATMLKFLQYLKEKYQIHVPDSEIDNVQLAQINPRRRVVVDRMLTNYNFEAIYEAIPTGKDGTSYTINKGQRLHMCVRNKNTGKILDQQHIMFVALHELAHMGNDEWGHGRKYWRIFKFVLEEAAESGIHNPTNYEKHPVVYCGLKIDYSPYYDTRLQTFS